MSRRKPDTEMNNCMRMKNISLFSHCYVYADVSDNLALSLFFRRQVRPRFLMLYKSTTADYRLVICKVRKKHEESFLAALGELPNKMLLCGHTDYDDFCRDFFNGLKAAHEKSRQKRACRKASRNTDAGLLPENHAAV